MQRAMIIAAILAPVVASGAFAQELSPLVRERIAIAQANRAAEGIRVQVGVNIFMPGPTGESAEAEKLRESARRSVYTMAARECGLLMDIIAKECRLESINVNVNTNRQYGPNAQSGYQVNGSIGLRAVLK